MPVSIHSVNENVHHLREIFRCSREAMGHIVGVSGKTIARWEENETYPTFLARQRVAELQMVLREMKGVVKKGKEQEWLNSPNEDLGHKAPLEVMIKGHEGVEEILHLLGRVKWGIPT